MKGELKRKEDTSSKPKGGKSSVNPLGKTVLISNYFNGFILVSIWKLRSQGGLAKYMKLKWKSPSLSASIMLLFFHVGHDIHR